MELITNLISSIPENMMIIFEIGIMLIMAGIFAFIFKLAKQPRIPAYVIAGIILGPLALGIINNSPMIMALSEIGVAFLLFFAGLEIDFKNLKRVGKVATVSGLIEMGIMALITIGILFSFGFKNIELAYITLTAGFSSTMVVIKLLSDKDELNTLHGRIIVGILLVQDIIAIVALTMLASAGNGAFDVLFSIIKAGLFALIAFFVAIIAGPIFKISAKSNELILLVSLSFLFLFAIAAYSFGLSLVVGAFFAGVALANSPYKTDIKGRIHPLRDFFGVILFVSLGVQLVWVDKQYWSLLFILIALIMIIKPLVLIITTRLLGYTNRTAFLTGNSLGQCSEFALILATEGLILGHIDSNMFSLLVFVTILTMSITSYTIKYEQRLYKLFSYPARIFNKIPTKKEVLGYDIGKKKKIVVLGCHRMGTIILKEFANMKEDIMIIDFNPEIIKSLMDKKIPCLYGDYANPEILEKIKFMNPDIIISTIPDEEDNLNLIEKIRKINKKTIIVVVAERIHEALELYKNGADYVILPKVVGGMHIHSLIEKLKRDRKEVKRKELDFLDKIHHYIYKGK